MVRERQKRNNEMKGQYQSYPHSSLLVLLVKSIYDTAKIFEFVTKFLGAASTDVTSKQRKKQKTFMLL